MKTLFLFAAVAGLGLVSASPPGPDEMSVREEARADYPPCSATVSDECVQRRERGVRAPENLAENRHPQRRGEEMGMAAGDDPEPGPGAAPGAAPGRGARPAYGGSSHYPPCSAAVKDECRQHRALARRVRMAGERG